MKTIQPYYTISCTTCTQNRVVVDFFLDHSVFATVLSAWWRRFCRNWETLHAYTRPLSVERNS